MIETIDTALIDWSRAQFALTAMYHWLFVPLTLGLGVIQAIMETIYFRTGNEKWKRIAQFWMKLFGINFAIGVATGIILEFEFGTNWSNYSWFVGDIFGAPLAIEGILAFFMEATFIAVMFFGWEKVSKRFHLASTWLTIIGATLSALWILIANSWMQYPVGMEFNPDTVRNEMFDFWAVALSPVAINKFLHTVLSGWIVGALFVLSISSYFLIKNKNHELALPSIKIAAPFGLIATLLTLWAGDGSAYQVAQKQPMKLAAMEGLYEGGNGVGLIGIGVLNPAKKDHLDDTEPFLFEFHFPKVLSLLGTRSLNGYVPGITNLLEGGYETADGETALSAEEKIARGKLAITSLANYRKAIKEGDDEAAATYRTTLDENFPYFGYGYIKEATDLVPNVALTFYSFRIMVILGCYFLLLFAVVIFINYKKKFADLRWLHYVCLWSLVTGYIAEQTGWILAEVGRQPWAIQDILPTHAAISKLSLGSVQTTFCLFLVLFTVLLIAEVRILVKAIKTYDYNAHQ